MTSIRRNFSVIGLLCLSGLVAACSESVKKVRVEDVQVKTVTAADIQKEIRDPAAKAILVNMWATWCGPCQEEFPDLVKVAHKYRGQGLKVMLVSADDEKDVAGVKKFLAGHGVEFPAYLKAQKDQAFIDGLAKQWSGALPTTFIFDNSGKLLDFWEGTATFNEFQAKVVEALGKPTKTTGGAS